MKLLDRDKIHKNGSDQNYKGYIFFNYVKNNEFKF